MTALTLRNGVSGFGQSGFAWAPAIIASLLANALLVAVLLIAIEPDSVPFKDEIRTRFQLSALDVPAQRAEAEDTKGEAAEEAQATGEQLAVRSVPSSRARPVDPVADMQRATPPQSTAAQVVQPGGASLSAARSPGRRLEPAVAASAVVSAQEAAGQRAAVAAPASAKVTAAAVAGSRARAVAPTSELQTARPPSTQAAAAVRPSAERRTAASASGPRIASAALAAPAVTAQAAEAQRTVAAVPATLAVAAATAGGGERLASRTAPASRVQAAAAPVQRAVASRSTGPKLTAAAPLDRTQALASALPQTERSAAVEPGSERLTRVETASPALSGVAPEAAPAEASRPQGLAVASTSSADLAGFVTPASTASAAIATRAAVAWSGGSNTQLDEQSLAAIQSFMQPGEVARSAAFGGSVKDGIGAALAQFPCSRLQAAFQPESGTLEIRGHVPAPALKADVVAMLERSVGGAIPVGSSLLVLPAPQCGVLDAAEGLGFVQSRDQENDPLEVGREAQAQILSFEEAQRVVFALQAPEFDAYIYVDYFDKDGTVVHVLPNDFVQDNRYAANQDFSLGDGSGPGRGLEMRVAPPFSQDIAVVLGTSHPLYERPRPLQEDAESYLSWLRNRIGEIRAATPDFRGEWAYLFVRTGPRGAFN